MDGKTCQQCGVPLYNKHRNTRYCCEACRVLYTHRDEKNAEWSKTSRLNRSLKRKKKGGA